MHGLVRPLPDLLFGSMGRQHRERSAQGRLRGRESLRLPPEIGEARRAYPLEIAAVRRESEVESKDLRFRKGALKLDRADDLPQLRGQGSLGAWFQKAGYLHGQRGATRYDTAVS